MQSQDSPGNEIQQCVEFNLPSFREGTVWISVFYIPDV